MIAPALTPRTFSFARTSTLPDFANFAVSLSALSCWCTQAVRADGWTGAGLEILDSSGGGAKLRAWSANDEMMPSRIDELSFPDVYVSCMERL